MNTDGKKLSWEVDPSNDYSYGKIISDAKADDGKGKDSGENTNHDTSENVSDVTYVLNTNTNKFHLPTCSSIDDMADKNKKAVDWTRETCISKGYDPCKRCNP